MTKLSSLHPYKKLGQNFLCDQNVLNKIIDTISINQESIVLEIGAGSGILTEPLLRLSKLVVAVEYDRRLVVELNERFKGALNLKIINKDILRFDLREFLKTNEIAEPLVVIGNIPYYITTRIIEYLIENIKFFNNIYLTVQKEYAQRLVAKVGAKEYSSISCFIQYFTNPKLCFPIKKTCFRPKPKVDSYFINLAPKDFSKEPKEFFAHNEKLLFKIINLAFSQRRKKIINALMAIATKEKLVSLLDKVGIDRSSRAENISLVEFIRLSNFLDKT